MNNYLVPLPALPLACNYIDINSRHTQTTIYSTLIDLNYNLVSDSDKGKGKGKQPVRTPDLEEVAQNALAAVEAVSESAPSVGALPGGKEQTEEDSAAVASEAAKIDNKSEVPTPKGKGTAKKDKITLTPKDYKNGNPLGFINPPTKRQQRIKWTVENDVKLLTLALGVEGFIEAEREKIGKSLPGEVRFSNQQRLIRRLTPV